MLRSLKSLRGYTINATDGDIGKVDDFFFDDWLWTIRYLVVDAGNWLSDRRVLVSPLALKQPDWYSQSLPVELTTEQVKLSPTIGKENTITRQTEDELYKQFNWWPFWRTNPPAGASLASSALPSSSRRPQNKPPSGESEEADSRLRSMVDVLGYSIQARNGRVGHLDDFIIEDEVWSIYYVIVDTHDVLPGKKVLVSLQWVEDVDWEQKLVTVDLQRETVENSPEFDPSEPVNREYELMLYDYYGKPQYWVKNG